MTNPSNTTSARSSATGGRTRRDGDASLGTDQADVTPNGAEADLEELARNQEESAERAKELVAARVLQEARASDGEAADRLMFAARRDLLTELRAQEQEQARRQLAAAAERSEDAVAGLVGGVVTIVRSVLPAALTRPEEVIETTYALADQGLRVLRRLALAVSGGVRDLVG